MPFVRITHARAALTPESRSNLLKRVQDAVVSVEGEAMRMGVGVVLEESVADQASALNCLPFVAVTLVKDALSAAQRAEMAARIVEAIVTVEGEHRRGQIWVVIEESVASGEWSIGGKPLTLQALAALKQGRNPWV